MFTEEEKEKAKYFKFNFHPLNELEQYLQPKFLPVVDGYSSGELRKPSVATPKNIMLFWHNEELSKDVEHSIDKIRQHNSEYQIQLFNAGSAGEFIKNHYGQDLFNLYERRCIHPSMKSDLFRMCYLFQKGGIYIDVDIDCFGSLENIIGAYQFECFLFYSKGKPSCINNDFIACQPQNGIILAILEKLQENLTIQRTFSNVWECTGPGPVSIIILEMLMQDILADKLPETNLLKGLLLGSHDLASRAYGHAELEYKKTVEGNWRRFRLPRKLYQL